MNSTSFWGNLVGMGKRLITEKQEQALQFCHHDFEGLTQKEAAEKMNISHQAVSELLACVEKVLPQYFPILTKLEAKCYHWYMIEGWPVNEIAERTGQTEDTIYKALQRARNKGMFFTEVKGRLLAYDPSMDANVKHKF